MKMKILSINVGLLGHVDSGKTSLAKCLSSVASTACFDKNPQSQERGITLDLGFSSFTLDPSDSVKNAGYDLVRYTLVDCPGHASLIRTIIGGAQIIDLVLLIVDITKGIQTQTAECLVIAEIMEKPIIVVINKSDLIPDNMRQSTIKKVSDKLQKALKATSFQLVPKVAVSTKTMENDMGHPYGITQLMTILKENTFIPERFPLEPVLLSIDHCFQIKGKGTIMTGTVLQGTIKVHDEIEIPALKLVKKIKSMQMFRNDISVAFPGDRIGLCVTQFNPNQLERGLACTPSYVPFLYGAIIRLNKVRYYKHLISTGQKFHISLGHETVLAKATLFSTLVNNQSFTFDNDYEYEKEYDEENNAKVTFALLEFEKCIIAPAKSLLVGSKFDTDVHTTSCRIAFYGRSACDITDSNYCQTLLPKLLIFKRKQKIGSLIRISNSNEIIASLFNKQSKINEQFLNLKVKLTTGEDGIIESSFGQGGKVKIRINNGLNKETFDKIKSGKLDTKSHVSDPVKIVLNFKKYIFDKNKKLIQND